MPYQNIIFDLDGTLVDSLPGIEFSLKSVIARHSPGEALPELRPLIGPPLPEIFRGLWPNLDGDAVEELVSCFRANYLSEGWLMTKPYADAGEVLRWLSLEGKRLFLLTNKPLVPTKRIVKKMGWADFFEQIWCQDGPLPFARKSEIVGRIKDNAGLEAVETVLVGDSAADEAAARSGDFFFVAAEYGYGAFVWNERQPLGARINSLSQLPGLLLNGRG